MKYLPILPVTHAKVIVEIALQVVINSTQRCSSGFNFALGVSRHCGFFFHEHARVLKHNKYGEIDQFSKVDIQQINVSTFEDLYNFLLSFMEIPMVNFHHFIHVYI